jgi:predicted Ser/Thr protein kinase
MRNNAVQKRTQKDLRLRLNPTDAGKSRLVVSMQYKMQKPGQRHTAERS